MKLETDKASQKDIKIFKQIQKEKDSIIAANVLQGNEKFVMELSILTEAELSQFLRWQVNYWKSSQQ